MLDGRATDHLAMFYTSELNGTNAVDYTSHFRRPHLFDVHRADLQP